MQVKVYTIPLFDNAELTEELNAFLRGHKILTLDRQHVSLGGQAFWTFCITYLPQQSYCNTEQMQQRKGKVDYKEVLDEATFAKFSQLRTIRKHLAEQDAVPAYAVFTDSELSDIARLEEVAPENMKHIQGIGQKKVEKYGRAMCDMFNELVKEETE